MTTQQRALSTNHAAMFLYGLSAVLIGPTLPGMIDRFELSLASAGLIGSLQSAGGFLGALAALWVADRISRSTMIVVLFGLIGASLVGIGVSGNYAILLATFAASGFLIRLFDVILNAHTGELVRHDSGRGMSTLHMFFSVGAFVGPVVARGLMRGGLSWSHVFLIVGAGYFLALAVNARWLRAYIRTGARVTPVTPTPASATAGASADRNPADRPRAAVVIALLSSALFFYAIHQIGITAWLPYYLETTRGANPDVASLGLSMYWIGIIVGRFTASRVARRFGAARLLCIGAFFSALATTASVLVPSPIASALLSAVAGITSGATIPLAYSVGFALVPARTGTVTAIMSMIMLAGRLIGPWLIGSVADSRSLVTAMLIPALVLFATAVLAGAVVVLDRLSVTGGRRVQRSERVRPG